MNKVEFRKYFRSHIIILGLISLFEIGLIVRGIFVFDFTEVRHTGYFACYCVLLGVSLITLGILCIDHKKPMEWTRIVYYAYPFIITIWGACVSYLDMMSGNYPIVYLTIIMAVGCLALIPPVLYAPVTLVSSAGLLASALLTLKLQEDRAGLIINLSVFVIFSLFINYRTYKMSILSQKHEDELTDLSFRDELTGLKNKRSFEQYHKSREKTNYSLCVIEIRRLAEFNQKKGRSEGDRAIRRISDLLKEMFGENVFRTGASEFSLFTTQDAYTVKGYIRSINDTLPLEGIEITIQAGCVVATISMDSQEALRRCNYCITRIDGTNKYCAYYNEFE